MLNVAAIMGRLVADPTVRVTTNGKKVASMRLACGRGRKNSDGSSQADFLDVIAWEKRAGFAEQYLKKGMLISLHGRLQSRQYQDRNGNNCHTVEIVADSLYFCEPRRNAAQAVDEGGYAGPSSPAASAYSSGTTSDDFALIEDNGDLPF